MDNLRDILREATATNEQIYSLEGTVTAVNKLKRTCTVDPKNDEAELVGVRLQADPSNGFVLYPVVGSDVIVSFLDKDEAYVAMVSQVDTYELKTQAGESLGKLLLDTVEELINFRVLTNTGASLEVINKPALLLIKQRITTFFEN